MKQGFFEITPLYSPCSPKFATSFCCRYDSPEGTLVQVTGYAHSRFGKASFNRLYALERGLPKPNSTETLLNQTIVALPPWKIMDSHHC